MNKVIFATLIALSFACFAHGDFIKDIKDAASNAANEAAYFAIEEVLKNEYPDEPEMTKCMIDSYRRNHVADKIWTTNLITDREKLRRDLKPYHDEAHIFCRMITYFQTPYGIITLIGLFCLALIIICCLIRCVCC